MKRKLAALSIGILLCASLPLGTVEVMAASPTAAHTIRLSRLQARLAARRLRRQRSLAMQPRAATNITTMSASSSGPGVSQETLAALRASIVQLVNTERTKIGLAPLAENTLLDAAAQEHAADMVQHKYFSHTSQDGRSMEDRINSTGYSKPPCHCSYTMSLGENIAMGFESPTEVMQAWMHSPEHKDNILRDSFKEIGVGFENTTWVQDFGSVAVQ